MRHAGRYTAKLWAVILLPIVSCISRHDAIIADVDPAGWRTPIELVYENRDTVSLKEAALVLRYDNGAENGSFVTELSSPSGASARDTLDVAMAPHPTSNRIQELRLPYRTCVRLSEEGGYKFTITPLPETRGVWSAGIDFRNTDNFGATFNRD